MQLFFHILKSSFKRMVISYHTKQNGLQNMKKVQSKMSMGQGNPKHKHRLGEWTESSPGEKHCWGQVEEKLDVTQPHALAHRNPPVGWLTHQGEQQGRGFSLDLQIALGGQHSQKLCWCCRCFLSSSLNVAFSGYVTLELANLGNSGVQKRQRF